MTSFRKYLTILLVLLTLISCALPAYATEGEETPVPVPEDTTAPEESREEEREEPESTPEPSPEPTEEPLITPEPTEQPEETPVPTEEPEPSPVPTEAPVEWPELSWQTPGSTTIEIQGGGTMLTAEDAFYYSEWGLWKSVDGDETLLADVYEATNLNLSGEWLYFTDPSWGIARVSIYGGAVETVLAYDSYIEQMYVIGRELRFVADGNVYSYDMGPEELTEIYSSGAVLGLLPTEYGNIYITGDPFERSLWLEDEEIFSNVESCYTDSGYVVIRRDGEDWQISMEALFSGSRSLESYALHQDKLVGEHMSMEEALIAEQAFFDSPEYAEMLREEAATAVYDGATTFASAVVTTALTNGKASQDQINMAKRARQMADVLWTPLADRNTWGGGAHQVTDITGEVKRYMFAAGATYRGLPYSQPVYTGYVGWHSDVKTVSAFVNQVNNADSKFYSGYSTFGKTAPYYGTDCSGFVSWAWDLDQRGVCSWIAKSRGKYIGTSTNLIKLGDCIDDCSTHVVLVTDIGYDASGNIVSVEITEQTPPKMKVTVFGPLIPGKRYDVQRNLRDLQTTYFNRGYAIYRRNYSGAVSYTPDPASPVDEDGWISAPSIKTQTSADGAAMEVILSHASGHNIYYTIDGKEPSTSSTLYTGPIRLTETETVRAMVDPGEDYKGSFGLNYTVTVARADKPVPSLVSGAYYNLTAKKDSYISLYSENGDKIYYTVDGSEPSLDSPLMTDEGIKITEDVTIRCFAFGPNAIRSEIATYEIKLGEFYTITADHQTVNGAIVPGGAVEIPAGDDFTFTMQPDKGYKVEDVLVDGKSVGAKDSYTFENVAKAHSITAKFTIDLPFADVNSSKWYDDAVAFVYSNKYFLGTTDTTFGPNDLMTRGMLVTVLGRFAGMKSYLEPFTDTLAYSNGYEITIRYSASVNGAAMGYIMTPGERVIITDSAKSKDDGVLWYKVKYGNTTGWVRSQHTNGKKLLLPYENNFKDLDKGYYYGYVQWAYLNDIINGHSSTSFAPKAYISRQDLCVVLYNYLTEYLGKELSTTISKTFTDASSIQPYAANAVNAMVNIGVIGGHDDGRFGPNEGASRAQVAQILMKLNEYLN